MAAILESLERGTGRSEGPFWTRDGRLPPKEVQIDGDTTGIPSGGGNIVLAPEAKTGPVILENRDVLLGQARTVILNAITASRQKIDTIYPNAGFNTEDLQVRIKEEKTFVKMAKASGVEALANWLIANDHALQKTPKGRQRKEKTIFNIAKRQARSVIGNFYKNPEMIARLPAKYNSDSQQTKRLMEIAGSIDMCLQESKGMAKAHRQVAAQLRIERELLTWDEYLSNKKRFDALNKIALMEARGRFRYYNLSLRNNYSGAPDAESLLARIKARIPFEITGNKKGITPAKRRLIEIARQLDEFDRLSLQKTDKGNEMQQKSPNPWLFGLGVSIMAAGPFIDSIIAAHQSAQRIQVEEGNSDPVLEVLKGLTPTDQIADSRPQFTPSATPQAQNVAGVIEEVEAILRSARATSSVEAKIDEEIAALNAGKLGRLLTVDQELTVLNAVNKPVSERMKMLQKVFGDNLPPVAIKLPPGSNPWNEAKRYVQEYMEKPFGVTTTDAQFTDILDVILNNSGITREDARRLPVGFELDFGRTREFIAYLVSESKGVQVTLAIPPAQAEQTPPPLVEIRGQRASAIAQVVNTGIGSGRFNITEEEVAALWVVNPNGRRTSCMEFLAEIEASFADLEKGVVTTMNAVSAAESGCSKDAKSSRESVGPAQIHKPIHKEWIEERFGLSFETVAKSPRLAFQAARQIFNWQGFNAWDVCGINPAKAALKPVIDCLRLTSGR